MVGVSSYAAREPVLIAIDFVYLGGIVLLLVLFILHMAHIIFLEGLFLVIQ